VLHWETYDNNDAARRERLEGYDLAIKALGIYTGKDGAPARGWTEVMAKTVSKPPRAGDRQILREILIVRGFKME
jgi:hypothetical protein